MPWLELIGIHGVECAGGFCGNGINEGIVLNGERGHLKHGMLASGLELQRHKSLSETLWDKGGGLPFPTYKRSGELRIQCLPRFLNRRRTARPTRGW